MIKVTASMIKKAMTIELAAYREHGAGSPQQIEASRLLALLRQAKKREQRGTTKND